MICLAKGFLYSAILLLSPSVLSEDYHWQLPPGFPQPQVPIDNPMSDAKVKLGRHLFYEKRLSLNRTYNCASCHRQQYAFTDQRKTAIGATGQRHSRNSMSLTNVAFNASYTWADPAVTLLEKQIHIPLFNDAPVEMGLAGYETQVLTMLHHDARYKKLFIDAFPGQADPVSVNNIVRSLASFVRTFISGDSPYDRFVYQDKQTVMSDAAKRGMRLFFSDRTKCADCHSGFNFSGPVLYDNAKQPELVFHNNGLLRSEDKGVYEISQNTDDMGKFRAPTLRNIAVTAPYMHDGTIETLEQVIELYASGGVADRNKSKLITGFHMTQTEKEDLICFLESLTDAGFLNNTAFFEP